MNLKTMGACVHYEFPESQQIYYSVFKRQVDLWKEYERQSGMFCQFLRAYGEAEAKGYFVYRSLDSQGHINALGVMRCGEIEKICTYAHADRKSFQVFCKRLANAQASCTRKEVAA